MKTRATANYERKIEIKFLSRRESKFITLGEKDETAEEICFQIARELNIGPLCRQLFSLQRECDFNWLHPNCVLQKTAGNTYIFRQRLKTPTIERVKSMRDGTLDYYYHQACSDIVNNRVRGLDYDKFEDQILGLSVAEMYRSLLEGEKTSAQILSDFKKYVPKVILKKHKSLLYVYLKKEIYKKFEMLEKSEGRPSFVRDCYLNHFNNLAPEYLCEEVEATLQPVGSASPPSNILILVNPYHPETPGILTKTAERDEWQQVCTIDDLVFVSIRKEDNTVEISRRNGIPVYFKFPTVSAVYSFVSLLDGYYRLTAKWTFNLCTNITSPALPKLNELKCHGPVGYLFANKKLQEKCDYKAGYYILRECEKDYFVYYLDVCTEAGKMPRSYRIERSDGLYKMISDGKVYPTLTELIAAYKSASELELRLVQCLPPSEFDKSQTLICAYESWIREVSNTEDSLLSSPPQCINITALQVFKQTRREGRCGKTVHFSGYWKNSKRSRVQVAIKELKKSDKRTLDDERKLQNEFLELAGRWASLQSNMIVKMFGMTVGSDMKMITEYLDLGPLDMYLLNSRNVKPVQEVDLVEAAASLAKALWQLEEAKLTHGYIRCKKMYVAGHEDNSFRVKLGDPGLHRLTDEDVPWIPPEFYSNEGWAKSKTTSDVWAYGTTLWEIFSMGTRPEQIDRVFYRSGGRLPKPQSCPPDIWRLILECWNSNPYLRKKPQAIMRDIHLILFQAFNSRRADHSYESTYAPTAPIESIIESVTESGASLRSDITGETVLDPDLSNENIPLDPGLSDTDFSAYSDSGSEPLIFIKHQGAYATQVATPDVTHLDLSWQLYSQLIPETIFHLGPNCNVILQGCIGRGFYGEVYKGLLEEMDHPSREVAVKKMRKGAVSPTNQNLIKEIEVMRGLRHRNIVDIVGVIQIPDTSLVMEYVPLGSLSGYIERNKFCDRDSLKRENLLKFAEDIAQGMAYLGTVNVVHRDLAARNILVKSKDHAKISDFGLAQVVSGDYYFLQTRQDLPIKWYAPECLKFQRFSTRSDVWSYGITLYEMFSLGQDPRLPGCSDPISSDRLLYALEYEHRRLPCPADEFSDIYRDLMMPCWELDSHNRPPFTRLVEIVQEIQRSDGRK